MQELDALGPTETWLEGIPPGKIGHFAGEARVTTVEDFVRIGEAKRLTLLASLIHVLRTAARDEVTEMFCKRMAIIHRKGRERLEELREEHRAESEHLLEVFGDVLAAARDAAVVQLWGDDAESADPDTAADAADMLVAADDEPVAQAEGGSVDADGAGELAARTGRGVLKALADAGGLEHLTAAHQTVAAYHGNNYLPLLEQYYKSHRSALFTLADWIEFEATSEDRSVLDALEFVRAVRHRRGEWIEQAVSLRRDGKKVQVSIDIDTFASVMWKKTLTDKRRPGMLARRHLEVCVFSYLAAELRSGDIAVVGSDSYANLHTQMMTWEECEPHVAEFCEQAGIPADAKALVAFFKKQLTKTAATVDKGYPKNTDLRLEGGKPVLARCKGADRRPEAIALEGAVLDRLPDRSLLDILARTAHLTGWHRHFGPASGSDPKIRGDRMGRYVVTAFAYGGNLGPTEVARHMRGVSAHEIYTAGTHADGDKIHSASGDVINAFAKLDVAMMWGRRVRRGGRRLAAGHLGEQPAGRIPHPLRRVRRHRLPADIRQLRCVVLQVHPLWGVGGGVLAGLAVGQRLRHPARPDPRRYPGPVVAYFRARGAAGVRSSSQDQELARPELLPADPGHDVQTHRRAVRGQRDRLGPAGEALEGSDARGDLDPGGPAVLGDAAAPAG